MTDEKLQKAKELKNEIENVEFRIQKVDVTYHPPYYSSNLTVTSCDGNGSGCKKVHDFTLTDEEAVEMLDIIRRRAVNDIIKLEHLQKEYDEL